MVSVIVPVYNGEREIEACLESIQSQRGVELEILVIDDGSKDSTWQRCCIMARKNPGIRLFRQKNAGVSAARNRGLEEAKGEFVLFVDSDDLLPPGAVVTLRTAAQSEVDFVKGTHELFRGISREKVSPIPGRISFLRGEGVCEVENLAGLVCGQLYRRRILEEHKIRFPVGLPYGEDTVFNLEFFRHAREGVLIDTVVYRRRKGGFASSVRYYPDRDRIALTLIQAYASYLQERDVEPELLRQIIRGELSDAVSHYLIHCPQQMAAQKTEEMREQLCSFLPENLLPDSKTYSAKTVLRRNRKKILLRKIKKTTHTVRKKIHL